MSEETPTVFAQWDELFVEGDELVAQSDEAGTQHAWSAEPDDDRAATFEPDRKPLPRSLVVLLTGVVVGSVGLSAFVIGQHAISTPHSRVVQAQQMRDRPAVGESSSPAAASQPQVASVQPPPAHPRIATPPGAAQTFSRLLGRDGFFIRTPDQAAAQAQASCAYLAQGGTMAGLISSTAAKSPGTTRQQAAQVTRDGVDAYCPQYENK